MSTSWRSCRFSRRSAANFSRSALANPSLRVPASRSASAQELRQLTQEALEPSGEADVERISIVVDGSKVTLTGNCPGSAVRSSTFVGIWAVSSGNRQTSRQGRVSMPVTRSLIVFRCPALCGMNVALS
jgi:hypothetical protein